jgi:hypothetical protein
MATSPWLARAFLIQAGFLLGLLGIFGVMYLLEVRELAPDRPPPPPRIIWDALVISVGCVILWAVFRAIRPRTAARAVKACLEFGHCPACAYRVHGAPVYGDGCTVCPECGAAWRLA